MSKIFQETMFLIPKYSMGSKKHGFSSPHKPKATRNIVSTFKTNEKKPKTTFPAPKQTKRLKKRCFREQNTPNVKKNQEILLYSPSR